MRQLFLEKGAVVVKEVSQPYLDDHSVLVVVHYSFVGSETDISTIVNAKKNAVFGNVPEKIKKVLQSLAANSLAQAANLVKSNDVQTLGHACSGVVIAVGKKVKKLRTGDFVACAGLGFANHADIICVPEYLSVKVTKQEHLKVASLTALGARSLQGIRRAQLQLGELVCVIGLGLLGQITVQLAKLAGCRVVAIDLLQDRVDLALKFGADAAYNATTCDVAKELAFFTEHYGVDTTFITATSKETVLVQQAMQITRKKGRVVIVGDIGLSMEWEPFNQKEIDLLSSCSYGPGSYDREYEYKGTDYPYSYVRWTENRNMQAFIDFVTQGSINLNQVLTVEVGINEITKAYEKLKGTKSLGVIIRYTDEQLPKVTKAPEKKQIRFMPAKKDTLRVGVVGAGCFAQATLLPLIARFKQVSMSAIVDADVSKAINVSRSFGVARALAHDEELFTDDLVDAVVIASPHTYHCEQALRAMRNGKAVFVEKPMVTDNDQLARLHSYLKEHPNVPFCIDYNRSFAPFIQKIKKELNSRNSPLIAHYRVNAGFIPKEHWVHSDVGAGRIIGDACQIIDLFYYLTDSKPVAVSVEALHTEHPNLFPTDNFSAQIAFADGSICSLLYTALGHPEFGKERMELFFDSKSILMDNYECLAGFGLPKGFDEVVSFPDKGHGALLKTFFDRSAKDPFIPPIPFERLYEVARLTLIIDQLACTGGGTKELTL